MNHQEFKEAFEELTLIYGEKAYPPAIKAKLFHMLGRLEKSEFRKVVETLMMEHTRPPAAGIILKAAFPFLKTADARQMTVAVKELEARAGRCRVCENAGVVFVYSRANPAHEYSFRCAQCDAATVRRFGSGIPAWRPEFSRDFMTLAEKWAKEKNETPPKKAPKPDAKAEMLKQLREMAKEISKEEGAEWGF